MSIGYIVLTAVVAIYLIVLLVSGIMAYKYQKTHKPMKQLREEYYQEWNLQKNSIDIEQLLQPINVKLELPVGEKVYLIDDNAETYILDKKSGDLKNLNKTGIPEIDAIDSYYDDNDFISLKSSYKVFKKKIMKEDYLGVVYITNKRIMFETQSGYEQLPLSKIIKTYVAPIAVKRDFYKGYIIHTKDEIYQVVSSHPESTIVLNELLRFNKSKKGEQ
ncbi:hypothetical protein [[Acholeplasma] multilocale]|uniref:hypothetical protein n=1 Tax=[Acholeplasma] multilocale TaxID=264638 RepID=UPI00047E703E|nr:hypothetical protein [[Acholeplasma] multilocale]